MAMYKPCWRFAVAVAMAMAMVAPAAVAQQTFVVGDGVTVPANDLALSQPVVLLNVIDPVTDANLGPVWSQPFLLDTGASGVFIAGGAFTNLDLFESTNAYMELSAAGADLDDGIVFEQGIGGSSPVQFSAPYDLFVAADGGTSVSLPDTRMLVNPDANFGGFAGIVGTPAMVGRVSSMDMTIWSGGFEDLEDLLEKLYPPVVFGSSVPAAPDPAMRFAAPLHFKSFPYEDDPDPAPANSPLPFATGSITHGTVTIPTDMLIDTGAQLSLIAPDLAVALGLGEYVLIEDEQVFVPFIDLGTIEVGGVGGTIEAPLVFFDRLTMDGEAGDQALFNGVTMIVVDIHEDIPLIFGSDFLTSGWMGALFEEGPDGFIDHVHFDFRNAGSMTGTMYFDFNSRAVPEPGVLVLMGLGAAMILAPRRKRRHR